MGCSTLHVHHLFTRRGRGRGRGSPSIRLFTILNESYTGSERIPLVSRSPCRLCVCVCAAAKSRPVCGPGGACNLHHAFTWHYTKPSGRQDHCSWIVHFLPISDQLCLDWACGPGQRRQQSWSATQIVLLVADAGVVYLSTRLSVLLCDICCCKYSVHNH